MEFTKSADKVAVLLSSYNGERYIKNQVDSILSQDVNLSLFIRDDGSTDQTKEIIKAIHDSRITLIESDNIGVNSSYFNLLTFAKTLPANYKYFAFSDQDDVWFGDKLNIALRRLKAAETSVKHGDDTPMLYGSASLHTDADLNPTERNEPRKVKPITLFNSIIQVIVPGHTYVFNRALLDILPDDIDLSRVYYYDGFIMNTAIMAGKFIYDPSRHTFYRQHSGNLCGNQKQFLPWIKRRLQRVKGGDSKQYGKQIAYLYELYGDKLTEKEKREIEGFIQSKTFRDRFKYIRRCRLYRQKRIQTTLFKLLYLTGGYTERN